MTNEEVIAGAEAEVPAVVEATVAAPAVQAVVADTDEEEPLVLEIDDVAATLSSAHDDFDWAKDKRGKTLYSDAEIVGWWGFRHS